LTDGIVIMLLCSAIVAVRKLLPPVRREHELAGHFRKTSCKANASRALGFNMCQRAILSEIMSCPTMSRRHFLTYRLIFGDCFYHVYYHLLESSYVPERGRMLESTKQGNMVEPDNAPGTLPPLNGVDILNGPAPMQYGGGSGGRKVEVPQMDVDSTGMRRG
jgi:hypothetical protein